MRGSSNVRRSVVAGVLGLGLGAALVLPMAAAASAKSKIVQVGNNTAIAVPPGWSVSHDNPLQLGLTHNSPHAVIEVAALTAQTGSVVTNGMANFNQFASGFGLTHIKESNKSSGRIPGNLKFDEGASVTYTAKYQGQTLGGLAVEYQNSTTGDGAFAVVIAKQSDKPKLKKMVNQMFNSIAANTVGGAGSA
jgi:hypothetical protein